MLTQCAMSFSGEPSTTRLHLFIRGMRYFTALRSVQYDNFALRVILSVAKNLKKKKNADTTSFRTIGDSPSLQSLERQEPQLYYSRKSFSFKPTQSGFERSLF